MPGSTVAGTADAGSKPGQLSSPYFVSAAPDGYFAVSDYENSRVQLFPPGLKEGLTVTGGPGSSIKPTGVAANSGGGVLVADEDQHRIQYFSKGAASGITVAGGEQGDTMEQLNAPQGIAVARDGGIVVADYGNHRVQYFAKGSTSARTLAGGRGTGDGPDKLSFPTGVACETDGGVLVVDQGNKRVLRFTAGSLVAIVVASREQLLHPIDVTATEDGGCLVTDTDRVWYFPRGDGEVEGVTVAGGRGAGNDNIELNDPAGVDTTPDGGCVVVDRFNHRVQRFVHVANIIADDAKWTVMENDRNLLREQLAKDVAVSKAREDQFSSLQNENEALKLEMAKLEHKAFVSAAGSVRGRTEGTDTVLEHVGRDGDVALLPQIGPWMVQQDLASKKAEVLSVCKDFGSLCLCDLILRMDALDEESAIDGFAKSMGLSDAKTIRLRLALLRARGDREVRRVAEKARRWTWKATAERIAKSAESALNKARRESEDVEKNIGDARGPAAQQLKKATEALQSANATALGAREVVRMVDIVWVVVSAPVRSKDGQEVQQRLQQLSGEVRSLVLAYDWRGSSDLQAFDHENFRSVLGEGYNLGGGGSGLAGRWQMGESLCLGEVEAMLKPTLWFSLYSAQAKGAMMMAGALAGKGAVVKAVCIEGGSISRLEAKEMPRLAREASAELKGLNKPDIAIEVVNAATMQDFEDQLMAHSKALDSLDLFQQQAMERSTRPDPLTQTQSSPAATMQATASQGPSPKSTNQLRRDLQEASAERDAERERADHLKAMVARLLDKNDAVRTQRKQISGQHQTERALRTEGMTRMPPAWLKQEHCRKCLERSSSTPDFVPQSKLPESPSASQSMGSPGCLSSCCSLGTLPSIAYRRRSPRSRW